MKKFTFDDYGKTRRFPVPTKTKGRHMKTPHKQARVVHSRGKGGTNGRYM